MKYFLRWTTCKAYEDYLDGGEEFATLEEAIAKVNDLGGEYTFRLIKGVEIELKAVQFATKYEVVRG